ncbi:MAG: alpha/beta fold hydrolase [Betaproteobacteria bacterium]
MTGIATGHFAELPHGIRLHYAAGGTPGAPLLLCLHGFPEYWGAWQELMPLLADGHYVVAPDLRGFNLSSQPTEVAAYRARAIVRDLAALVAALGYRDAAAVAHDWGGAVAWQWAIAAPAQVRRLVSINSPHPIPFARALATDPAQQAASAYMNWLRAPQAERLLAENDYARLVRFFTGMARPERPWLTPKRLARYREVWARGLTGGLNYYRASPLYPPCGGDSGAAALTLDPAQFRVRVPTLVLWGEADTALLPSLLDPLPELIDDLTVERLPHATHWLLHEEPEPIAASIRRFLAA